MRLDRLRVRGLRSFARETEIDLRRLGELGLFAITGPTGAGKSTILDGIFLALFGKSPRGEASECVSVGATELSVRLELTKGRGAEATAIAVERRFRWAKRRGVERDANGSEIRGAGKHPPLRVEVRRDGVWEAADLKGRRADEYLHEEVVRVSMRDFQQAVVLPQGEFDALLRARPSERRALVASLFRTEHLGQPLVEVLKAREGRLRDEVNGLEEAEREVFVGEAEAIEAASSVETAAAEATAATAALTKAEAHASAERTARQRCAARDAASATLADADRVFEARAADRERALRGRRAAGAHATVVELESAESAATEAAERATEADAATRNAEARRRTLAAALSHAAAERLATLPSVLSRVARARLALDRSLGLAAIDAERDARTRELATADRDAAAARTAHATSRARFEQLDKAARELAIRLDAVRVGEDERAEAVAQAALAELLDANERANAVVEAEISGANARASNLAATQATAEQEAHAAFAIAERLEGERRRIAVDAERAVVEVEAADLALVNARRAAAAADLAATLNPGEACPVCGSREHPSGPHPAMTASITMAERALAATRRAAKAVDHELAEATRRAGAAAEEARAASARAESVTAELTAAREAATKLASGELVPLAITEARANVERLSARAELALASLPLDRRPLAHGASRADAEARLKALATRGRAAEALEQDRARADAATDLAASEVATRLADVEAQDRRRAVIRERADAAASAAKAARVEIAALVAELEPRGQRGLFDAPTRRTAREWVDYLEAEAARLTRTEEDTRASFDEARAEVERTALEARETAVRRRESNARLTRARAAAEAAMVRAGFADLESLRSALIDPVELEVLEGDLERIAADRQTAAAVLAERRRDAQREVSEAAALEAERERDRARARADAARERAGEAAARSLEITRRRARAVELRAKIDALLPRARRLAQIRQVVASGQLSELAAERHLEAVTRGAAELLARLSSNRYTLVRDAQGAFAVADGAYGGLVRAPSTLSGGETFLVSLALALSLSERIQLAGRTRFDFFFLDEGFGSLDAGTLEVALGALEQLRGPTRVIGMISHVPAIEERMPRRLRVGSERRGGATVVAHEP